MAQLALETLFGSALKVRILGFLLQSQEKGFTIEEIRKKLKIRETKTLKKELSKLHSIKLLKTKGSGKRKQFLVNLNFYFYPEIKNIFVKTPVNLKEPITKLVKKLGSGLKLLLISGFFLNEPKTSIDLLLVGKNLKEGKAKQLVEDLESEIGRELNFAIFNDTEFSYRYNMSDRFLLGILEGPREIIINRFNQGFSSSKK